MYLYCILLMMLAFLGMMNQFRKLAIVLLIFNGISAIGGGAALMLNPTGKSLNMPLSLLRHSPLTDFLIPGLLLFVFNGLSSVLICLMAIWKRPQLPMLLIFQGIASVTWIVVQCLIIQGFDWLHGLYGGIGLILLSIGMSFAIRSAG